MPKTLLLGLDGATFEMLAPLLETGRLPMLAKVLKGGAYGILQSTVPPVTFPAWPTMYTGRNPGAHGLISFAVLDPEHRVYRGTQLGDVPCPRLWTILNRHGVRTGLFNVPGTYPSEPVDGFMVSGFITPPKAPDAVQPVTVRDDFAKAFPHYDCSGVQQGIRFNKRARRRGIIEELNRTLRTRLAALEWMLQREPVDFLWVVLETIDRFSHYAYAMLVPGAPLYEANEGQEVREWVMETLELHDQVIGRILELMGPDPVVMVVSDHGFAWTPRHFDLAAFLMDNGLMVPATGLQLGRRWKRFLRQVIARTLERGMAQRLAHLRGRVKGGVFAEGGFEPQKSSGVRWDWNRSKTWLGPRMEYGVRVNVRLPDGTGAVDPAEAGEVVEAVVQALRALRDPATGTPVFEVVKPRENLYQGPFMDRAPDVLLLPRRDVNIPGTPVKGAKASTAWLGPAPDLYWQNYHDRNGVFAGVGGAFVSGQVPRLRIVDVLPTLMYAMGLEIPPGLDGRVHEEAFTEAFRQAHPVRMAAQALAGPEVAETEGYSDEEEAAISRRLEDLGYM